MADKCRLVKDFVEYLGAETMQHYVVRSYQIVDNVTTPDGHRGVSVTVKLGRKVLNEVLTNFLPTTLICIVSFSTNFFHVRAFVTTKFCAVLKMCSSCSPTILRR